MPRKPASTEAPTPPAKPKPAARSGRRRKAVKLGDTHPDVLILQHALNGRGFRVKASGEFDRGTHDALAEFQGRALLPRTSIADAATWRALEN